MYLKLHFKVIRKRVPFVVPRADAGLRMWAGFREPSLSKEERIKEGLFLFLFLFLFFFDILQIKRDAGYLC